MEAIEDIVRELRSEPLAENGAKPWLHYLADRVLAAHKREMAAKDAEIARLRALVEELIEASPSIACAATMPAVRTARTTSSMRR